MDHGSGMAGGYLVALLILYFLPTIAAVGRKHHQRTAIFVLNLFLGWTFIGWVAALVMAATAVKDLPGDLRACPHCAERIRKKATVCRFCNRPV